MSPITEPTEEYFKDGLWGWVTNQWKKLVADAAGHLQVDVLTSGLPAGGATAANQATMITALQLIDDLRNALDSVGTDELDVNVETSALPAGAATAAKQTTMITALQLIDDLRSALNDVGTDELRTIPYLHGIWGATGITQVFDHTQKTNGLSIFYTVPSGKTLYLTTLYMQSFNNGAGDGTGRILIRDASDVIAITWRIDCLQTQQHITSLTFFPPLEVPENYDFVIDSDNAGYSINVSFTGYTL